MTVPAIRFFLQNGKWEMGNGKNHRSPGVQGLLVKQS